MMIGQLASQCRRFRRLAAEETGRKEHWIQEHGRREAERDRALSLLREGIRRIKDTSRFGKSKEGAALRLYLMRELLSMLASGDSFRSSLESEIASAESRQASN